jgi:hypothetical protein
MKALKRRVAALEAKPEEYVQVASPAGPLSDVAAMLDALGAGRPYSVLHRSSAPPASPNQPIDPTSPGGHVAERLESLRRKLAEDPGLDGAFDAARKDTIRQIESENRQRERKERQRAKKARRKERQAAAVSGVPSCPSPAVATTESG